MYKIFETIGSVLEILNPLCSGTGRSNKNKSNKTAATENKIYIYSTRIKK